MRDRSVHRQCFAAIVVVTFLGFSQATADSTTAPIVFWGPLSDSSPEYATWSGSSWSTGADAFNYGCDLAFVSGKNCPTRDETGFMAVDYCNSIKVFGRSGTTWTSPYQLTTGTNGQSTRMFDIAYETTSGDAMLVFWDGDHNDLEYRIATSSSLSAEYDVADSDSADIKWVKLVSHPSTDEIIVVWLDSFNDIYTKTWNGSSWGSTLTLTTT
ncbi:MAG: hypothetical protein KDA33_14175, partial [Phycisphaerales bacterium]|nr:hypothetical protein [Phycisphaerales bacterium]